MLLECIQNWELSVSDPYKVWFACAILSHAIMDNEQAKKMAGSIVFGDEAHGKAYEKKNEDHFAWNS